MVAKVAIALLVVGLVIGILAGVGITLMASTQSPQISPVSTMKMLDFGWAPEGWYSGGSGMITYEGVGDKYSAQVTVQGLKKDHDYAVFVMGADVQGNVTPDFESFKFKTDADGKAVVQISLALSADAKPIPAYQVHILVVEPGPDLEGPLPNPFGINQPIALACESPMGFRVG